MSASVTEGQSILPGGSAFRSVAFTLIAIGQVGTKGTFYLIAHPY